MPVHHKNKSKPEAKQLSGSIEIAEEWARPAAKEANTAAYFSIYNGTTKYDTLLNIQSEIADKSEIHESYTTEEGLSGMRTVSNLAIAPGDSLVLKPGGMHVMLMSVPEKLAVNDTLKLRLMFSGSGSKPISIPVQN